MAVNGEDETSLPLVVGLENEDELREAFSVLVGSDPDHCSYSQGYVKRQAVFACSTCTPTGSDPAGVCLACANTCHDGHHIFELYTKRNFRCDCGNKRFGSFKCTLVPDKDLENPKNCYNHNFFGRYCSCDRMYPDADDQVNDEMIQCVICEDWFHEKHLGCVVEDSDEPQEMICEACMNKTPLLWTYVDHFAAPEVTKVSRCQEDDEVNVEDDDKPTGEEAKDSSLCSNGGLSIPTSHRVDSNGSPGSKRTHQEMNGCPLKYQAKTEPCKLKELESKGPLRARDGAVIWPYHWRSELCTCVSCKRVYVNTGVQFLLDQSDTLLAYERRGLLEQGCPDQLLMSCLRTLSHVQQLEIIYQINDMKTELMAFLQTFVEENKEVTAEAIWTFFEDLKSRKRRRTGDLCLGN
ncbi:putative E3 ubiquitin-protein ligase UBR7 [Denticeps clupeoides]|uniref:UBR-type domain-containing protein n=1 Tax=Denticeps clupeoides TaxID=299321 RepID=A0AAY4AQS1_9TELE|nr:putative E3 ubiquitin-protein ligase UBR7 [Denticeps clupeoides]XP_028826746.1 putative E3 ubiquitin-protein ligase UBR7 [Denticeps clupeoides]